MTDDSRLTVELTLEQERLAVIRLTGELDRATAWRLRRTVVDCLSRAVPVLVLDLEALDFCDSSGLAGLTGAQSGVAELGGRVLLAAVPDRVTALLKLVGLETVLPAYGDVEAALAAARLLAAQDTG